MTEKIHNFFAKKKTKLKAGVAFLQLALMTGSEVVFADSDPTATLNESTKTVSEKVTTWALIAAGLMVVIGGTALMLSDETRRWAKKHILWVLVGVVVVEIATSLIAWVVSVAGG